ncbi:ABC transporter permease [Streptomyces sp. 2P-4]|uniref:ABC transporter permease n=1 Tax=Streptomyces sp. 2P-4 TaxID=2931974 RepID=UPI0025400B4C|nr:ABC transporter permease [Streptomyces sp. 2P-4]
MNALALKGPYRAAARLHRRALWALPLLAAAGLAVVIGLRAWAVPGPGATPYDGYGFLQISMQYAGRGLLFLPAVVGAFVAGPLISRERESGTWRLALTQSADPRTWLRVKVLLAAATAGLGSAALIGVYRIGWTRVADTYRLTWADRGAYEASGPVLVGYCLLAVALGALVGQLVRRTLPAMAVAGLSTGAVMWTVGSLRWSILPVTTTTMPLNGNPAQQAPASAFITDTGLVTGSGERLPEYACWARTQSLRDCPGDMNVTSWYTEFHPASHYWPTQLIETSLALALAALAFYAALRLVRTGRP